MAQLALNRFQTVTLEITTSDQTAYTAPTGYTAIVLYAHVTNITTSGATVTMSHVRSSTTTEVAKDVIVPANDAYVIPTGIDFITKERVYIHPTIVIVVIRLGINKVNP